MSAPKLTLADCRLEELFAKDARRATGVLAEIQSHAAPLHGAFVAYATAAPLSKRKSAKGSGERPAVMPYAAWCRFAADRRLPRKAVKASTDHIYARSESVEGTAGCKPSEGHLLFAEFVGGLVRLALQLHKAPPHSERAKVPSLAAAHAATHRPRIPPAGPVWPERSALAP